jgi:hypothetical protein
MYRPTSKRGPDGRVHTVWRKPDLRRVSDKILRSIVFLYPTEDAAIKGEGYGGSGFIASYDDAEVFDPSDESLSDPAHAYIVTNAHVARTCHFVRTLHDFRPIIQMTEWTEHPDDDIAIAHAGIWGHDAFFLPALVHRTMFVTPEGMTEAQIGPGDQLFMVGRFTGLDERERHEPTVRAGTLSMASTVPVENAEMDGRKQESFFAEVNSKAGYSGSPVYVEIPTELPPILQLETYPQRSAYLGLLGITWGLWRSYTPLLDPETRTPLGTVIHENSGIELVVPAWKILELFKLPSVLQERKEAEARMRKVRKQMKPEAVATDAKPQPDAPAFTRGDMEAALRKVSRRVKPSPPAEGTSGTSE